jgi:hypothetical protein
MKFKVNDVFYTKNNNRFQLIEINKFPGGEYYKLEELLYRQWNFDLAIKWYFDQANSVYLKEPVNFYCAYKDLFKFESVLRKPGECTEQELILLNREFLIEKDYYI